MNTYYVFIGTRKRGNTGGIMKKVNFIVVWWAKGDRFESDKMTEKEAEICKRIVTAKMLSSGSSAWIERVED
jgi:hypothetical protein